MHVLHYSQRYTCWWSSPKWSSTDTGMMTKFRSRVHSKTAFQPGLHFNIKMGSCLCYLRFMPVLPQVHACATPGSCLCYPRFMPVLPQVHAFATSGSCLCYLRFMPVLPQVHACATPGSCLCYPRFMPVLPQVHACATSGSCLCYPRFMPLLPQVHAFATSGTYVQTTRQNWLQHDDMVTPVPRPRCHLLDVMYGSRSIKQSIDD